jgi:hypothetical protein
MEVGPAGDLLQFSGSAWLRRLAWGTLLAATGLIAHVIAAVLGNALGTATWAGWVPWIQVIAAAIVAAGLWLLTARERGGAPPRRALAGQAARWLAITALVLWGSTFFLLRGGNVTAIKSILVALCVLQAATAFAAGFFLSALAARIPQDSLSVQFANIAWLLPGVLAMIVADLLAGLQAQFGFLFYCVFPTMGVMAALILWPAGALLHLTLELRNAATAADAIVAKREARAAAQAAPKK